MENDKNKITEAVQEPITDMPIKKDVSYKNEGFAFLTEDTKKKIARKAVAVIAAVGVLIGGIFNSPANTADEEIRSRISPPPGIQLVTPDLPDDGGNGDDDPALPEEEKKRKGIWQRFSGVKLRTRIAIAAPILAIVWILGIAIAWNLAAINIVLSWVGGFIISAALIAFTYMTAAKILFPEMPLKKIMNSKALILILFTAFVLSILPWVLKFTLRT